MDIFGVVGRRQGSQRNFTLSADEEFPGRFQVKTQLEQVRNLGELSGGTRVILLQKNGEHISIMRTNK